MDLEIFLASSNVIQNNNLTAFSQGVSWKPAELSKVIMKSKWIATSSVFFFLLWVLIAFSIIGSNMFVKYKNGSVTNKLKAEYLKVKKPLILYMNFCLNLFVCAYP